MHTVKLAEAQPRLPELTAETQQEGLVIVPKDDRPGARLAAVPGWPLFGLLKGKMTMAADFDEPLEEFRAHVE